MVKMIWERKGPWEKQLLFQSVDPFNHAQTWEMFLVRTTAESTNLTFLSRQMQPEKKTKVYTSNRIIHYFLFKVYLSTEKCYEWRR